MGPLTHLVQSTQDQADGILFVYAARAAARDGMPFQRAHGPFWITLGQSGRIPPGYIIAIHGKGAQHLGDPTYNPILNGTILPVT